MNRNASHRIAMQRIALRFIMMENITFIYLWHLSVIRQFTLLHLASHLIFMAGALWGK